MSPSDVHFLFPSEFATEGMGKADTIQKEGGREGGWGESRTGG